MYKWKEVDVEEGGGGVCLPVYKWKEEDVDISG